MDTEKPIEDLDRQQPVNEQPVSNSAEDQIETNSNVAPLEDASDHLINGTAEGHAITSVGSHLQAPSAATSPTKGHVEPPYLMTAENGHAPVLYEPPIQESIGEEHDERNVIVPMPV